MRADNTAWIKNPKCDKYGHIRQSRQQLAKPTKKSFERARLAVYISDDVVWLIHREVEAGPRGYSSALFKDIEL